MRKLALVIVLAALAWPAAESVAATACCATARDGSSCIDVRNRLDVPSGCLEDDGSTSCAGGTVDPDVGRAGCLCVHGTCRVGEDIVTAAECADAAAAACCDAGWGRGCR